MPVLTFNNASVSRDYLLAQLRRGIRLGDDGSVSRTFLLCSDVIVSLDVTSRQRRLGTTMDMALTAVYLASSAGSFVTGDTLAVDGKSLYDSAFDWTMVSHYTILLWIGRW